MLTALQERLKSACAAFGLQAAIPAEIGLPSGKRIDAKALIHGLGGAAGMIIVTSFDQIEDALKELQQQGYGFSVLSEPNDKQTFDIESYREMFEDWGLGKE
jgi:hypothetical protein